MKMFVVITREDGTVMTINDAIAIDVQPGIENLDTTGTQTLISENSAEQEKKESVLVSKAKLVMSECLSMHINQYETIERIVNEVISELILNSNLIERADSGELFRCEAAFDDDILEFTAGIRIFDKDAELAFSCYKKYSGV